MILEGQTVLVQGSGKRPYEMKNTGGVLSCSCPSWRNAKVPIDLRTCKHLKTLLGEEHEIARVGEAGKLRLYEKAQLNGPPVMLAHSYDFDVDVTGWWYSEKLDGVRGYWDGEKFLSRQGNVFHAPDWFKKGLPATPLDGELYLGRKRFEETISIVKRLQPDDRWKGITYRVFDAPQEGVAFEHRLILAGELVYDAPYAAVVAHARIQDREHLHVLLATFEQAGAEGLMLRRPGSPYEAKRSHHLLKVKPFKDAEAVVVGYAPGKGKHKGRVGALNVMLPDGKMFELGTGLSDAERENPPAPGTTVTFRYTELTAKGIPKCASFLRVRPTE